MQERFSLSKRYEVFATPFAFLIDERGMIAARGIVSTKQYLGFVLTRAGRDEKARDSQAEPFEGFEAPPASVNEYSLSYSNSKGLDHV
jgi:hypothetical protein